MIQNLFVKSNLKEPTFSQMSIRDIIFTLVLSCFCAYYSSAQDKLNQGEALNSSSTLVSKNGIFTLQFITVGTTDSNGSYFGIWFNSSFGYRPCWIANRNIPIPDNSGVFAVDASGTMKLNYSGGEIVTLYSNMSSNVNLTTELEDSGNLVLRDANSPGQEILWQSFDSPTDSFLPGMKLGTVNGQKRFLTSWLSNSIPASGAFTLEWDPSGSRLVIRRRGTLFWTSGPLNGGFENMYLNVDPVDYSFTNVSRANEDYLEFSVAPNKYSPQDQLDISMWVLNFDGSLRMPQLSREVAIGEICNGNSRELGCEIWGGPTCRTNGDIFEMRSGYFAVNGPREIDDNSSLSISDCKDICWKNCSCVGVVVQTNYADHTGCEFYLANYTIDPSRREIEFYVIVEEARHKTGERNWIWIFAAVAALLVLVVIGIILYMRRKRRLKERIINELLTSDPTHDTQKLEHDENEGHNLKLYSAATIMTATNSFSIDNQLGQGGFGPVYKGKLVDGQEVAVKRLSRSSGQGLVEFKNELILIAKLQHTNLVRLLGFCIYKEEKMLVYEYMPNKSLDSFIFDESKRKLLDWNKRFKIIEGIAQGLLYLHKYSRLRIIHRDLKVSNILIDEYMNPKISDFGMARIFKTNESEANTHRIVGTYGYMSPEYAMKGIFSVKSDVFSFGVLVLEIISGRKNHGLVQTDPPLNLVEYGWQLWKEGAATDLLDQTLRDSCSKEQVLRCVNVGLLCVEENALDRPLMSDVISMLTSEVALPTPKQPAFTNARSMENVEVRISQGESSSINSMSISTTIGGR